jgi:hypothetical protein
MGSLLRTGNVCVVEALGTRVSQKVGKLQTHIEVSLHRLYILRWLWGRSWVARVARYLVPAIIRLEHL